MLFLKNLVERRAGGVNNRLQLGSMYSNGPLKNKDLRKCVVPNSVSQSWQDMWSDSAARGASCAIESQTEGGNARGK